MKNRSKCLFMCLLPLFVMNGSGVYAAAQDEDSESLAAVSSDQLKEKRGLVYVAKSKKPYTGLARTNYPSGEKFLVTSWVNGKQEGPTTEWYMNGQKKSEEKWVNGKEHGPWMWWRENGQKEAEENWVNGKQHGFTTHWHENGQKEFEGNFVNGKNEGPVTWWYENGQKEFEGNFVNGKEKRGSKCLCSPVLSV